MCELYASLSYPSISPLHSPPLPYPAPPIPPGDHSQVDRSDIQNDSYFQIA